MSPRGSGWEPVYRVVRRIPAGRVASYGQVAALAGMPRAARQVGYALHALPFESDVPWHRVVNAQGAVAPRGPAEVVPLQRSRLEAEGIAFSASGRIDLARYGWQPRARAAARKPKASGKGRASGARSRGSKA